MTRGARNKSFSNLSDLNKENGSLSSAGVSLCLREAGERNKESDAHKEPVWWRERGGCPGRGI